MSKRALVLVEGQTEERFLKDVLYPFFQAQGLYLAARLLVTKKVKHGPNFKGGVTSFGKFENDLRALLGESGGALVTTMLDYNGLPDNFPGMHNRPDGNPESRIRHVEAAIHAHFGSPRNLLPFLALHEFEAWLFSSTEELAQTMLQPEKKSGFARIRNLVPSPEDINEDPQSAPSRQIRNLFPAYRKTLHGPVTLQRIGIPRIRCECPHFDFWMRQLESYSKS